MNRDLTVAALVVTTRHALDDVGALISKERPAVAVSYSSADEHLQTIRNLKKPSVIAVVSGSRLFLDVACAVLAPAVGRRHQLREILLPEEDVRPARAADLVFCDSIARKQVRLPKAIHYRLLQPESISYIATAMKP
jgi:hypothetical protein